MPNIAFRASLASALLASAMAAHAGGPRVLEQHDNFRGTTLYSTPEERPRLEGGSFITERYVYFTVEALKPVTDVDTPYIIRVRADLRDWVFISEGPSLELKIDGQIESFSGPGSLAERDLEDGGIVSEAAEYPISRSQLGRLASASSIQFRVLGDKGSLTGTFTDSMLANIRLFSAEAPGLIALSDSSPSAALATKQPPTLPPGALHLGASFMPLSWMKHKVYRIPGDVKGVLIVIIQPGSVAASMGIQLEDVITSVDGKPIQNPSDLQEAVKEHPEGAALTVTVFRNGEMVNLTMAATKSTKPS